jgi:DNA-binding MurR/RpiR family transcriptional regulator
MPRSAPQSLIGRIRGVLDSLSVSERRLADVILDFPGNIASYSASELAKLANVSNATVTRFIRRLGYEGYDDARKSVRSEHTAGSPLFLAGADQDAPVGSQVAHLQQGFANLEGTFRRITDQEITALAREIIKARKAWIVGYRASHGLAYYLRWQIVQVVENALLLPGAGETLAETIASMTKSDVVVVFALRRRVAVLKSFIEQAMQAGVKVALISNNPSTDRLPATWHFRCDSQAPGPLDNHVAVMALCHLLATRILEMSGAAGRRRLATIETLHEELSEL